MCKIRLFLLCMSYFNILSYILFFDRLNFGINLNDQLLCMFIILTMSPVCIAMLYHDQVFLYLFIIYQYCYYRSRPHAPCGVAKAISGVGGMVVLRQSSCSHCHLGRKTHLRCQLREGTVTHSLARLLRPTGTMFYWLFALSTQCNVDYFNFLRYYKWFFF